jgi:hypothetical protein
VPVGNVLPGPWVMPRKPRTASSPCCRRPGGRLQPTSTPVTWPPSGSLAPPGCHPPPKFVTARCSRSGCRLRRLNLGDCARVHVLNRRPRRAGTRNWRACMPCRPSRPPSGRWHGQEDALPQGRRPKSCAAPNGSGRASRRSRNTMRVKPYAIRSPSRNARHTALRPPGGSISTSGCSCRYRSSLRTWSGGPGGTSCTGQYRYPLSGPRNRLLKTRATRRRRGYGYPSAHVDAPAPITTPVSPPHAER